MPCCPSFCGCPSSLFGGVGCLAVLFYVGGVCGPCPPFLSGVVGGLCLRLSVSEWFGTLPSFSVSGVSPLSVLMVVVGPYFPSVFVMLWCLAVHLFVGVLLLFLV